MDIKSSAAWAEDKDNLPELLYWMTITGLLLGIPLCENKVILIKEH